MMSETGDSDPAADDAGSSDGGEGSRDHLARVSHALAGLVDECDHLGGFAVRYADARRGGKDRTTVEVRCYYPTRHPAILDRAMGMLQGHGFQPEKRRRGGNDGDVCLYLSVPVGEDAEDRDPGYQWDSPSRESQQDTF